MDEKSHTSKFENYSHSRYLISTLLGNRYANKKFDKFTKEQEEILPDGYTLYFPRDASGEQSSVYGDVFFSSFYRSEDNPVFPTKQDYEEAVDAARFNQKNSLFHNAESTIASSEIKDATFRSIVLCILISALTVLIIMLRDYEVTFSRIFLIFLYLFLLIVPAYFGVMILTGTYEDDQIGNPKYKKAIVAPKMGSELYHLCYHSPFFAQRKKLAEIDDDDIKHVYWEKHSQHFKEIEHFAGLLEGAGWEQTRKVEDHIKELGQEHYDNMQEHIISYWEGVNSAEQANREIKAQIIDEEINSYRISRGKETL